MKRIVGPVAVIVAGLAVATTFVAAQPLTSGQSDSMSAHGKLIWADEFNGSKGAGPDPAIWRLETGGSGWGNEELQYYTDNTANASMDGAGNLAITALRENPEGLECHYGACRYTSARLLSAPQLSRVYGRFEARLKVPAGQGFWPAFWMLGDNVHTDGWPDSGEIDIMEHIGKEPHRVFGSLHGPGYSATNSVTGGYSLPGGQAVADDFHVFTVDWGPDSVTWYVDGVEYLHKTRDDVHGNPWVFDHSFFLILNLAVGGVWPGPPDDSTQFPQSLLVDYVRVYELSGEAAAGPVASHKIQGYAGKCVDVDGAQPEPGAALVLRECSAAPTQRWSFEADSSLRTMGLCAEAATGPAPLDGAELRLASCKPGPAQQFGLNDAADLVNLGVDKCVDVKDWNPDDGAPLQLWGCAGSANQKWWRL